LQGGQDVFSQVKQYVEKHEMIKPGDKVIAGISGGADSVCLLFMLLFLKEELDFSLAAVHVNHNLRGEEALRDEEFVRRLCEEQGVPLTVRSCQVRERAEREHLTLEEAGRACRYEVFEEEAERQGCSRIAVAHHGDDQAETMLFHLFRGTGLKGLGGMEPVSGKVIRPLLCTGREEILEWLETRGISWCTDSTNEEETYTRNCIRRKILGCAKERINPQAARAMCRTAEELRELEAYLEEETDKAYRLCVRREDKGCFIFREAYKGLPSVIGSRVLRRCFGETGGLKDVERIHIRLLENLLEKQTGSSLDLPGGRRAIRDYQGVWLVRESADPEKTEEKAEVFSPEIPGIYVVDGETWQFSLENAEKYQIIPEKTYTKWFDYDKIVKSLEIRRRRPGDYLEINREHGRKKLKNYLIDQKIPARERDRLWVLADGEHILWVPGRRISEGYKVTENTRRILKVQIVGGSENG